MRKHISNTLAVIALSFLAIPAFAADYNSEKGKFSYALGFQIGNNLKQQNIKDIDPKIVGQAIADVLAGSKLKVSEKDMQTALTAYQQKMVAERKAAADKTKTEGDKFRAENKKKKGVKELPNGIQYKVLKAGKGEKPTASDKVTVHYHGTLINGDVFDSSVKRGKPASFPLKGVIKGWQEVLPLMQTGAKWNVVIPPELAYGERGAGGKIGPSATLIFEIELISIDK